MAMQLHPAAAMVLALFEEMVAHGVFPADAMPEALERIIAPLRDEQRGSIRRRFAQIEPDGMP